MPIILSSASNINWGLKAAHFAYFNGLLKNIDSFSCFIPNWLILVTEDLNNP